MKWVLVFFWHVELPFAGIGKRAISFLLCYRPWMLVFFFHSTTEEVFFQLKPTKLMLMDRLNFSTWWGLKFQPFLLPFPSPLKSMRCIAISRILNRDFVGRHLAVMMTTTKNPQGRGQSRHGHDFVVPWGAPLIFFLLFWTRSDRSGNGLIFQKKMRRNGFLEASWQQVPVLPMSMSLWSFSMSINYAK